ncbi:MAG: hypothetical protein JO166_06680 [Deltaproteobacteria bacterium]|nr:hypothetical protein [Deltaproteobacteria bacterium]
MSYRLIVCAALCVLGAVSTGSTQNMPPGAGDRAGDLPTAAPAPNDSAGGIGRPGPKKLGSQIVRPPYPSNPLSYQSNSLNYQSNASSLQTQQIDPNRAAAQKQSGLNQADATSLIRTQGYARVGEVRADPNSIWVWQADAMKNGRKVRLGIDSRGNLLEISSGQPRPCTTTGVGFGAGPMGVGSRLSQATDCAAR